jgi:replication-associated recombination protein RarA
MTAEGHEPGNAAASNMMSGTADVVLQARTITGDVHLHQSHPVATPPSPHELPSTVFGFTDRTSQLEQMNRVIDTVVKGPSSGSLIIFAISGTAGVGKTAFATHWAHQVRDRFRTVNSM